VEPRDDPAALIRALDASDVRYVLIGSLAAAAHGMAPQHGPIEIVPALDIDNLHRVARFLRKSDAAPRSRPNESHAGHGKQWSPSPVSVRDLDRLFDTRYGQVDVVPRRLGRYRDLHRRAIPMEAFGRRVFVAEREDLASSAPSPVTEGRAPHAGGQFRRIPRERRADEERQWNELASACESAIGPDARLTVREPVVSETGYRNTLIRCDLERAGSRTGTVLLKKSNLETPEIFREWAGFQFLNGLPKATRHVPVLHGGDVARKTLILEDLGDVRELDLASILADGNRREAEEFLVRSMKISGEIHAASIGRLSEYRSIRATLPAVDIEHAADRVSEALRALGGSWKAVGDRLGRRAREEASSAAEELENPGAFLAYTRGDVCTKNLVWRKGEVTVFDLEWGGFRHALIDGAFPGVRSLHCLHAGRFPAEVRRRMQNAYREALSSACDAARDDGRYGFAAAAANAGWLAVMLEGLPEVLERDKRRGSATLRQRILAALETFRAISCEEDRLPALGDASEALLEELRGRWGNTSSLPLHPVFL
jgi:hypothetical protein